MQISSQERLQLLTDFAEFLLDVAERQGTAYYYVISGGDESAPSSLCHLCRLSDEEFSGLLIAANLATYDVQNRKLSIKHDEWCKFIDTHDLSNFIEKVASTKFDLQSFYHGTRSNPANRIKYHTLQLGMREGHNKFQDQVDITSRIIAPPHIANLRTIQQTLGRKARRSIIDAVVDNELYMKEKLERQQQQLQSRSVQQPQSTLENAELPAKRQMHDAVPVTPSPTRPHGQLTPNLYRFLGKQSIDPTDLPQLEDLQAELALVLMENGVIKYHNKSGGATQSLIKIPVCSTDKVFRKHCGCLDSFIKISGSKSKSCDVAARRIVEHCIQYYYAPAMEAIERRGIYIVKPMDEIAFAALILDCQLSGIAVANIKKHLLHHFGRGVFPADECLRSMSDGHSKVVTGVVTQSYTDGGKEETVEFKYKNISDEFLKHLAITIEAKKIDVLKVVSVRCTVSTYD